MKQKILSLAGDGIGQEVVPVSIEVLKAVTSLAGRDIEIVHGLVGGDAIDGQSEDFWSLGNLWGYTPIFDQLWSLLLWWTRPP